MFLFDRCARGYDEMLVCFSINQARDGAWLFANELSGKSGVAYDDCIATRDRCIAALGQNIVSVKGLPAAILKIVSRSEWRSPGANIRKLRYVAEQATANV